MRNNAQLFFYLYCALLRISSERMEGTLVKEGSMLSADYADLRRLVKLKAQRSLQVTPVKCAQVRWARFLLENPLT